MTATMDLRGTGLVELGQRVRRLPGVRAVWFHRFSEEHAGMWILVSGVGDSAWLYRRRVHAEVSTYLRFERPAMEESGFIFELHVFMEHEEVEYPRIPPGARQIAA
jgi:hypothetical protein